MAWTTPRDWTSGEVVTESMMDVHVKDNLTYLYGVLNGTVLQNLSLLGLVLHSDGSLGAPSLSFTSDPDTGIFRATTNTLALVAGGAYAARFGAGAIYIEDGTLALPSVNFAFDNDNGIYRVSADKWRVVAGASTVVEYSYAGGTPAIGFMGQPSVARQVVGGSRGGNVALASLLSVLSTIGLVSDITTA